MVLPGLQALFGFQLVVVFSSSFFEKLGPAEERLHLLAIVLVVAAIALIMTPAAYHRQTGPRQVSYRFIALANHLLLWSMVPLAIAICVELYLINHLILKGVWAPLLAAALLTLFIILWSGLPRSRALQKIFGEHS